MTTWQPELHTTPMRIASAPPSTETHASTAVPTAEHGGGHGGGHESPPIVFYGFSLLAFVIIILVAAFGTRRMKLVPTGLQNIVESVYEVLYGIPEMVMGPRGRQYGPFVGTFFIYIVVMNAIGLIPGMKAGTASLSVTLGLAIVAFLAVQYFGFRTHGIRYLLHFLGPVMWMAWLIAPLELISEVVRIASLSIRLYGNIYGEEQVIGALANQLSPFVPVVMLPIQLLTIVLQAFVFSLLVTVYISLATEQHESHEHASHPAAAAAEAH